MKHLIICGLMILGLSIGIFGQTRDARIKQAVEKVINDQAAAWNRGDIDAFMQGYWNSPEMTFVSGDTRTKGWQPTLERYKTTYNTRAKMGELSFTEIEITVTSKKSAVVFGRFTLVREKDRPTGLFTLNFRKFKDGWKIILDHTS